MLDFRGVVIVMVIVLVVVWIFSLFILKKDLGKVKSKLKFIEIFLKSGVINYLLAVCMFLFGVCDVWFVVVLLVYLVGIFGWDYWIVGGFLVVWVIVYGIVQGFVFKLMSNRYGCVFDGCDVLGWVLLLVVMSILIVVLLLL